LGPSSTAHKELSVPLEHVYAAVASCLRARRLEIEQAVLARLYVASDLCGTTESRGSEGLRPAVSAALDYSFAGIERGEEGSVPPPTALLAGAHFAARNDISLDAVLRCCFAGYAVLGDFLMEEAENGELFRDAALKRLLRVHAALFERLAVAVTEEYSREVDSDTAEQRHAERVERLLGGASLDTSGLDYEFDMQHLGAVAAGPGAAEAVRDLAKALDRRLLLIRRSGGAAWAWLGGHRMLDPDEFERAVSHGWPSRVSLAIGEPAEGLGGWRFTHQQARAALPIALRSRQAFVRYSDVALLASMLQDDVLATTLREHYLIPLSRARDGGAVLRQTLRAYFTAERNVSSAAAALGVSRQTVINRLGAIEERIARPLGDCAVEMEAALRLEGLGSSRSL
jgi:hypothetical protein